MAHLTRDAGATDAFEVPASQMGLVVIAKLSVRLFSSQIPLKAKRITHKVKKHKMPIL